MIQKEDLRIGNLVLFDDKEDTVHSLLETMVTGNNHSHWYYERLHGIPISPEILLNFGFRWYDNDWYEIEGKLHLSVELHTGYIYFGKGVYLLKADVKYLHQLQNLIFCLSGQELKPINVK